MSHVALLFGSFKAGGVARVMIRAASGLMERGHRVDLVVGRRAGDLLAEAPRGAGLTELRQSSLLRARTDALWADPALLPAFLRLAVGRAQPSGKLRSLPSLVRYLRASRPDAIIAATAPYNMIAVWANRLAGGSARIVATEHNQLSAETIGDRSWRYDLPPGLMRRVYLQAEAIVSVSDGVKEELVRHVELPPERITTVYNPIVDDSLLSRAAEPLDHPWLAPGQPPVIIGVGGLKPQKGFPVLIDAFARLRAARPARLMILGDAGPSESDRAYRAELHALPRSLGIADDVAFPGFVGNPFPYMRRAALFVLSSAWEGLPTVLVEALACGTPAVSTDCPSGPAEILAGGRYGRLVPVGDAAALAGAIAATLDAPLPRDTLQARGAEYSVARSIDGYLALIGATGDRR
jgi:glycosyltransferase involved in cell wall biosynthesis